MPEPKNVEEREQFVARCCRLPELRSKPIKDRLGMCYGLWRESHPEGKTEKSTCSCEGACSKCQGVRCYTYKLADPDQMGMAGLVSLNTDADISTDDGRMCATGVLCTARRDWVGDVVNIAGVRLTEHQINPIILWDHGKWSPYPVGLAETLEGQYTVVKDLKNEMITQTTYFNNLPASQQLYHLVKERQIRANSIAFKDLIVHKLPPDPDIGLHKPGRYVETCAMVEGSWVPAPMNPDAVLTLLGKTKVEGDPLHWTIRKGFEQFGYHLNRPTSVTVPDMSGITYKSADARQDQWPAALTQSLGAGYPFLAPHEFCSTQLDIPEGDVRQKLVAASSKIAADDIIDQTDRYHCTLLWGIHPDHGVDIGNLIAGTNRDWPVTLEFGAVSVFEGNEHDTVVVEVRGRGLRPLRNLLRDSLPNTQTFPAYRPHVTLGTVKQGTGKKYIGRSGLEGMTLDLADMGYYGVDGTRTGVSLSGSSPLAAKSAEELIEKALPPGFTGEAPPDKMGRVYTYVNGKKVPGKTAATSPREHVAGAAGANRTPNGGLHGAERESDIGEAAHGSLVRMVDAMANKRDWAKTPDSFKLDAIKKVKADLQPHFRGMANNHIKARAALAKATEFADIRAAVDKLRGGPAKGTQSQASSRESELQAEHEMERQLVGTGRTWEKVKQDWLGAGGTQENFMAEMEKYHGKSADLRKRAKAVAESAKTEPKADEPGVKVGDIARFKEVVDPGDDEVRWQIVEDRGDRVLAKLICDLPIPPTKNLLKRELRKVEKSAGAMSAFAEGSGGALVPYPGGRQLSVTDAVQGAADKARRKLARPLTPREYIKKVARWRRVAVKA